MRNATRSLLAALALAGLAVPAVAQSSQGVDIAFTPQFSRAVTVTLTGSSYDFGIIQIGSAAVANAPIVVTTGGAVATSLSVVVSSPAVDLGQYPGGAPMNMHWALSTSTFTGVDTFALFAVFQSTKPINGQYADVVHRVPDAAATPQEQCASNFGNSSPVERFRGGQSGVRVPAGSGAVNLWLNLYPPTRSSNLKSKQFQVTVATGGCD
jgi:hypothetical protein